MVVVPEIGDGDEANHLRQVRQGGRGLRHCRQSGARTPPAPTSSLQTSSTSAVRFGFFVACISL
jgi:hypothetical protein